jgi:hypothetical protein
MTDFQVYVYLTFSTWTELKSTSYISQFFRDIWRKKCAILRCLALNGNKIKLYAPSTKKCIGEMWLEVFIVVNIEIMLFWVVQLYSMMVRNQHFMPPPSSGSKCIIKEMCPLNCSFSTEVLGVWFEVLMVVNIEVMAFSLYLRTWYIFINNGPHKYSYALTIPSCNSLIFCTFSW